MHATKKGNQWYFGMKAHVGTDIGKGLVHSIVVTNAAVHDSQVMDGLLHGEEQSIYGDSAYSSETRKTAYESKGDQVVCESQGLQALPTKSRRRGIQSQAEPDARQSGACFSSCETSLGLPESKI